jgi:hypothetical protein
MWSVASRYGRRGVGTVTLPSSRCGGRLPGAANTRLPDAVPVHPAARDGCPRQRRKGSGDPCPAPPTRCAAPPTPRPKLEPTDRALLAAISRVLPRSRWSCFLVKPETLLRWHRRLVAGVWTYPHDQTGRPPLDREVLQLIIPPGQGEPSQGLPAHQGRTPAPGHRGLGHHHPYDAASAWVGSRASAGGHQLAGIPASAGHRDRRL